MPVVHSAASSLGGSLLRTAEESMKKRHSTSVIGAMALALALVGCATYAEADPLSVPKEAGAGPTM